MTLLPDINGREVWPVVQNQGSYTSIIGIYASRQKAEEVVRQHSYAYIPRGDYFIGGGNEA